MSMELAPWEREPSFFSLDSNKEFLRTWLDYDPLQADNTPDWLVHGVFYPAVLRGERRVWADLTPIPWSRHPASTGFWDTYFPDHCPGSQVVFPGAWRIAGLENHYTPVAIVVCHHFEYGDELYEYKRLYDYAKLLGREIFDAPEIDSFLAVVNPDNWIIFIVIPPYWLDFGSEEPPEYITETPEDALKKVIGHG